MKGSNFMIGIIFVNLFSWVSALGCYSIVSCFPSAEYWWLFKIKYVDLRNESYLRSVVWKERQRHLLSGEGCVCGSWVDTGTSAQPWLRHGGGGSRGFLFHPVLHVLPPLSRKLHTECFVEASPYFVLLAMACLDLDFFTPWQWPVLALSGLITLHTTNLPTPSLPSKTQTFASEDTWCISLYWLLTPNVFGRPENSNWDQAGSNR